MLSAAWEAFVESPVIGQGSWFSKSKVIDTVFQLRYERGRLSGLRDFKPAVDTEETVFAWGRRGGPDGSNASFIQGTDPTFGAIGHWGAADVGWNGASNIVAGQWTYVTYVYDGATTTSTVYKDGVLANTLLEPAALNVWAVDSTPAAYPLPFRVGAQNNSDGSPGGQFASMTIAKVRVYDQALSAQAVADKYNAERSQFQGATQPRLDSISVNPQNGAVSLSWTAAAGQNYSLETSTNLTNWGAIATNLATNSFTDVPTPPPAPYKFYRLRVP